MDIAVALPEVAQAGCLLFIALAVANLDFARDRPGGEAMKWLQADARSLRLEKRFDLVLLTGHAFQVFLSESDQRAVLETIAWHLSEHGHFVFDSRNPAVEEWLGDWQGSAYADKAPEIIPIGRHLQSA